MQINVVESAYLLYLTLNLKLYVLLRAPVQYNGAFEGYREADTFKILVTLTCLHLQSV